MGVGPDQLDSSMRAQYQRIRDELTEPKELSKLINQLENDRVAQLGSVQGIAEQLSDYELFYGDAQLINTEFERFRKVTPQDLQRVARRYLVPENQVTLYYLAQPKP
jgi:predicted Zn-dependent peptidase